MKRKYFSKDMNYERYLIILGKSLHAPPHSAFVDVSVVALLAEITSQDTA
jgi:hypothetical protein